MQVLNMQLAGSDPSLAMHFITLQTLGNQKQEKQKEHDG